MAVGNEKFHRRCQERSAGDALFVPRLHPRAARSTSPFLPISPELRFPSPSRANPGEQLAEQLVNAINSHGGALKQGTSIPSARARQGFH